MRPITVLARRTALRSCMLAAALQLLLTPADAVGATPEARPLRGSDWALTLSVDNDWFAGTDRSYTGGYRLVAAEVDRHPLPSPLAEVCDRSLAARPLALDLRMPPARDAAVRA